MSRFLENIEGNILLVRTNQAEYHNEVTANISVVDNEMETVADQSAVRDVNSAVRAQKNASFGYHSKPEFPMGTSTGPIFSSSLGPGAPPIASTTAHSEATPRTTFTFVFCLTPESLTAFENFEEYLKLLNTGAMLSGWFSLQQYHRPQNNAILWEKVPWKIRWLCPSTSKTTRTSSPMPSERITPTSKF